MLASLSLRVEQVNECSNSLQIIKHHSNITYYYCDVLGGSLKRSFWNCVIPSKITDYKMFQVCQAVFVCYLAFLRFPHQRYAPSE